MICVTHEMGFARQAADRVVMMDGGTIIEDGPPEHFFTLAVARSHEAVPREDPLMATPVLAVAASPHTAGARPVAITIVAHYEMQCGWPGPGRLVVRFPAGMRIPATPATRSVLVDGRAVTPVVLAPVDVRRPAEAAADHVRLDRPGHADRRLHARRRARHRRRRQGATWSAPPTEPTPSPGRSGSRR